MTNVTTRFFSADELALWLRLAGQYLLVSPMSACAAQRNYCIITVKLKSAESGDMHLVNLSICTGCNIVSSVSSSGPTKPHHISHTIATNDDGNGSTTDGIRHVPRQEKGRIDKAAFVSVPSEAVSLQGIYAGLEDDELGVVIVPQTWQPAL